MNIAVEIKEIVCEVVNINKEDIDPQASFTDEYNLDSLRALEILAAIENKFAIVIDPEKLGQMNNLNNVIEITLEAMKLAK